jgi:uncharacterized protein
MIIDIIKLKSNIVDKIEIDETISFKEELKQTEIISLDDVRVVGYMNKVGTDDYYLNVRVYGTMILPSSLTLKPTNHEFDFEIDGNIGEMYEEIGKNLKNSENSIDILPIIWENILTEIPMHIVNEDDHNIPLKGEGWRVLTGKEETVNPEFEKLKDLLK